MYLRTVIVCTIIYALKKNLRFGLKRAKCGTSARLHCAQRSLSHSAQLNGFLLWCARIVRRPLWAQTPMKKQEI